MRKMTRRRRRYLWRNLKTSLSRQYNRSLISRILDNPLFYLVLCIVLIYFLAKAYHRAYQESKSDVAYSLEENGLTDWTEIWREMNAGSGGTYSTNADSDTDTENSSDNNSDGAGNLYDADDASDDNGDASDDTSSSSYASSTEVSLIPINLEVIPRMQLCIESLGLSMTDLCDFNYLFDTFYTLNSGTSITSEQLDARTLLSKDLSITGDADEPQILIYHTHSQEAYADSVAGEVSDTVVGVGDYLTQILNEEYGYNVIHDMGIYDMTDGELDRDNAYPKAATAIEAILEEYPSIEVVIDLHRDGVAENVHLITNIDGTNVAKIMFFNGVCRDENGELTDITNPYREDNLAFSLQLRLASMLISEDFCRTNYLKTWRYNQHLLGRSVLVEVGAQTNTVSEAMNAMPYLAQTLDYVLSGGSG